MADRFLTSPSATLPRIEVSPLQALVDEPVIIRLIGFEARQRVTLRARMTDHFGNAWESCAGFITNELGYVDLSTQRPISGTYDRPDPMGIFWSMALPAGVGLQVNPVPPLALLAPWRVRFDTDVAGTNVASAEVERRLISPNVTRTEVRQDGIVATLFRPPGSGLCPAVIVVSGSEGGVPESRAALFASRGFIALALAYFGVKPLPPTLVEIPLEYFNTVLHWLMNQEGVNPRAIAVTGASRGGELALLLGATFSEIRTVVAYAPSGILWPGQPIGSERRAAWTLGGNPFPCFRLPTGVIDRSNPHAATAPGILAALQDTDVVEQATIPVERTRGPILLISGQDDQLWPSSELARIVVRRLETHRFPFPVEHLNYPDAGHLIFVPPCGPTTIRHLRHPVLKQVFNYGGTTAGDAFARADSWPRVLRFLRANLT
jgi:dienelactone hydrolase